MAWTVTINDLPKFPGLDPRTIERLARENIQYPYDALAAIDTARKRNLASCVVTGMRTPSPASDDEVVDISVRGMARAADFTKAVKDILAAGPDESTHVWEVDHATGHRGTDEVPDSDGGG